jgi:outer membrane protein assembly complex protein YaeT
MISRPFSLALRLALCAALLPSAASVCAQETSDPLRNLEGQRVAVIRLVTESGEVIAENPPSLPLQPGNSFNSEVVRECLRQLYRSGNYADIRAEAAAVPNGLRVDLVVQRNFFVNQVHVIGLHEPPGENLAVAAMRLGLGEPIRESTLKEALDRLRETLREDGFYQAQLSSQLTPHPDTRQADIEVTVIPGPRARIGAIVVGNQTTLSDTELLHKSKLKPKQELTSARLSSATERTRKSLVKKGYLGARVAIHRGEYDAKAVVVPIEFDVLAGPAVRVEIAGAKISAKDLRRLVPVYEEGSVDADLLQEGRRNIRDYFERQGYFDAQVDYTLTTPPAGDKEKKPAEQVINYAVERGKRRRLEGISFDGNKYFSDALLLGRLALLPAAFASPGRFSQRLLADDTDSILGLYAANGFGGTKVRAELVEDYHGKKGDLFLRFHIEEGAQTLVGELKLEGNHALSHDALADVIGSSPGQPYSEFSVASDRDNILALYYNEGFPEARFISTKEDLPPMPPKAGAAPSPRVRLTYQIIEGTQVRVAGVITGGYEHTRPGVINREIQLHAGEPLREGEVVDTQRRLYNLGIFSRVSIAPQNPAGTDAEKTMVALVEEAKRYTLGYGFGFEVQRIGGANPAGGIFEAGPRGLLEISKSNLTGRADTLSFKARASRLQYRGLVSYTAQNYFGKPNFSLQLTGFADKTRDVNTFTSTRYEGSLQLTQRVSLLTSLLYRYSFRKVLVDASSLHIAPQQIPLFSQPTRVSEFGITWFRERRNNPADTTRGDFNNVDFSVAAKSLGSSASFLRFFAQNSSYHPFGRNLVFARSVRFGWQKPLGNTLATEIPLPERFFAGGGNSLRGFGLNQAGPRDAQTGFPIGGLSLLVFNQELRFPMRLPWVGSRLGGAIFYDAGNIFSSAGRITFRSSPSQFSVNSGDLAYLSHTIGFGFRYATPIGPVRVDVAYQLNPARFQFCATGTPASASCPAGQTVSTARLPRFQFFFNLGSVF